MITYQDQRQKFEECTTEKDIDIGEEITCNYKYKLEKAPEWYRKSLKDHLSQSLHMTDDIIEEVMHKCWLIRSDFLMKYYIQFSNRGILVRFFFQFSLLLFFFQFWVPFVSGSITDNRFGTSFVTQYFLFLFPEFLFQFLCVWILTGFSLYFCIAFVHQTYDKTQTRQSNNQVDKCTNGGKYSQTKDPQSKSIQNSFGDKLSSVEIVFWCPF